MLFPAVSMTNPQSTPETYSWRLQLPIYASGFFNGNIYFLTGILMPLWGAIVVKEPFLIGLIVASRQILPVLLTIHGGALMDRFGARRIMLVFGAIGVATMAAFPFFPFLAMIIALQMLNGLAESPGWVGSQALVGQLMKGHATYAGHLSFALRLGGFLGPWLAGIAWHQYSPTTGFYFMALWIAGGWVAGWLVPAAEVAKHDSPKKKGSVWAVLPSWSDYVATFRMLGIASVLLVTVVTLVRQTGSGIQLSFLSGLVKSARHYRRRYRLYGRVQPYRLRLILPFGGVGNPLGTAAMVVDLHHWALRGRDGQYALVWK